MTLFDCSSSPCRSLPIDLGLDTPVYLTLYGTGIRNRSSLDNVLVTINGISVPALMQARSLNSPDWIRSTCRSRCALRGSGVADVVLKIDHHQANTVTVDIQ